MEFIHEDNEVNKKELEFVKKDISDTFNISQEEYLDLKAFIVDGREFIHSKRKVLFINNQEYLNQDSLGKQNRTRRNLSAHH